MNWTEDIPNLTIQRLDNGNLRLEDKSFSEGAIVDVHPSQIRLMAERLGLVRELSASDADLLRAERAISSSLRRELERLVPWLILIQARSAQLHDNIMGVSMRGKEDVNIEVAQSSALADIAEEVCNDAKAAVARSLAQEVDHSAVSTVTKQSRKPPTAGGAQPPQEPGPSVATASRAQQAALI